MNSAADPAGLAGIIAGRTALSTVGRQGVGLSYRGYRIEDLAEFAGFEEVAWLLLHGNLPDEPTLTEFQRRLAGHRTVPPALQRIIENLPDSAHPMDVLRTACSALGCLCPEQSFASQHDVVERLLGCLPATLMDWYRWHRDGRHPQPEPDAVSTADFVLRALRQSGTVDGVQRVTEMHRRALDVSLILYAEHEFNASTFAARTTASTLSDMYSAITTGIGTLRGPLHGGANEAAIELIEEFADPAAAERGVLARLAARQKIMGFGHRVYRTNDPRSVIIRNWSGRLSEAEHDHRLFAISRRIEQVMRREKNLFPNLDFYGATTFRFLGIPTRLFTPMFVLARTAGWAAHVIEQRDDNRLIRPTADYVGPDVRPWLPIHAR